MNGIKKYMAFDLFTLILIGCLLEGFSTKGLQLVISAAPTVTFSLLIVYIATARWNWWGLITVPFLAIANYLGGSHSYLTEFKEMYDLKLALSVALGLIGSGSINCIVYKHIKAKKFNDSLAKVILLCIIDFIVFMFIEIIMYRLLYHGNIFETPSKEITTYLYNSETKKYDIPSTVNVCIFVENGFGYNLFGVVVMFIGVVMLRSQGVVSNARDKLIDDKKEAELSRIDEETFRIQDEDDASKDDSNGDMNDPK